MQNGRIHTKIRNYLIRILLYQKLFFQNSQMKKVKIVKMMKVNKILLFLGQISLCLNIKKKVNIHINLKNNQK